MSLESHPRTPLLGDTRSNPKGNADTPTLHVGTYSAIKGRLGYHQRIGGNDVNAVTDPPSPSYSAMRARVVSTVVVLLYCMGYYPCSSVLRQYLVHRWSLEANISDTVGESSCFRNDTDPRQKIGDDIQARVSTTTSYYIYAANVPSLLVCILIGAYSDVIGRRKTILLPLTSTTISFVICNFIIRYDLSTDLFFLTRIVEGLGGCFFIVLVATFSISSDLSSDKSDRMLWLNIIVCFNQCVTAAFLIINGYIIQNFGFEVAAIFLTVPIALSALVAFFFLPETRPTATGRSTSFLSNLGRIVKVFTTYGTKRRRTCMAICLVIFFFASIAPLNVDAVDTLYQMHRPLCWDSKWIGYYGALYQGGAATAGVIYHSIAQRLGCMSDELLAMVGNLFQAGAYVLEAFVTNDIMMFMVPLVIIPSFPVVGIARGIMSHLAGPYNQGAVFAGVAVVEVLCSFASNTALNQVYAATVDSFAGAVYILMASICVVTFLLFFAFFYFYDTEWRSDTSYENDTERRENEKETTKRTM